MNVLCGEPRGAQGVYGAQDGRGTISAIKNPKDMLLRELDGSHTNNVCGIVIEYISRIAPSDRKLYVLRPGGRIVSMFLFLQKLDFEYNSVSDYYIEGRIWYTDGTISGTTYSIPDRWYNIEDLSFMNTPKTFEEYYDAIKNNYIERHIF